MCFKLLKYLKKKNMEMQKFQKSSYLTLEPMNPSNSAPQVYHNLATIPIKGPNFKYSSLFTSIIYMK